MSQRPSEIVQIVPYDGLIRTEPFIVQVWFQREVRNPKITVGFDGNPVDRNYIKIDEHVEQKYWKYNAAEQGWLTAQRNRFWILHWQHWLSSKSIVEYTIEYEWKDLDGTWKNGTWTFQMSHHGHTYAEADQHGKYSWDDGTKVDPDKYPGI